MKLNHKLYGAGEPIIIMHGLFGSGDNWRTIAKMIEPYRQSIVVDMRNHGRSPHDAEMNFQVMAEDIQELMSDLGIDRATILGHSMGGKVAMQFSLTYPEKVDKLIVVDIAPRNYPPQHNQVIEAIEAIRPGQLTDRSEAEEIFARYLGDDPSTIQFLMKNLSRLPEGGFEWKANMPVIINAYPQLVAEIESSQSFSGPSMFIRGQRSRYIQDEDKVQIEALFQNYTLVTIQDAGHWVHAEAPESFTQALLGFIKD